MESKAKFFLGANSAGGFYSLTDWLIDFSRAGRVLLIKGGPGCGKSTLMRRVGELAQKAGERVEYYHCCSDADSLDAVALPGKAAVLVDATPPHGRAAEPQEKSPGKVLK